MLIKVRKEQYIYGQKDVFNIACLSDFLKGKLESIKKHILNIK